MGANVVERVTDFTTGFSETSDVIVEVRNNDTSVSFGQKDLDSYIYDSLVSSFSIEGDDISLEREESLCLMGTFSHQYYDS